MHLVYIDESSQSAHRYMVIGGIIIRDERATEYSNLISSLNHSQSKPMKWGNVRGHNQSNYEKLINLTFEGIENNHLHFHSLIVDCSQLDHHAYNNGDRDMGFNKFLYQLLLHCFGIKYTSPMMVYLDSRCSNHCLEELKEILNKGLSLNGIMPNYFNRIRFRKFTDCEPLWMSDVIIGAIAYQKNQHHLNENAAKHKSYLADLVKERANQNEWWGTQGRGTSFSVWNFKLNERAAGPR